MKNEDHITEEMYDRMGFSSDTKYSGKEVKKPDTINQETRHCTKILSHYLQRGIRQRNKNDALTAKRKRDNYQLVVQNRIYERNDADTYNISPPSICGDHTSTPPAEDFQTLPIDNFKKLLVTKLKAFIHYRLYGTAIIHKHQLSKIPLFKEKLVEVKDGAINLLLVAFKVREL